MFRNAFSSSGLQVIPKPRIRGAGVAALDEAAILVLELEPFRIL
jgi:hypothetical protein